LPKQRDDALDEVEIELLFSQPDDGPARQHGFEILLGVLGVTRSAVVPTSSALENPALDFDQRAACNMCKVGAPQTGSMEPHFPLQGRTLRHPPE
jgi:hypothetical protein